MNITETTDKGLFNTKPDPRPVKNNTPRTASSPDWILYTVPASAFLIGIFVFAFICKTQRHRKTHEDLRTYRNAQVDKYTSIRQSADSVQGIDTKIKDDTQSYENVEAAIYSNQEKVTYYVPADQDYVTPDEVKEQDKGSATHQLPHNLTDTDGESYENMANLYAEPRKYSQQHKHATEEQEEVYINPDGDAQQDLNHSDTKSYEMMADTNHLTGGQDNTEDDYISPDDNGHDHADTVSYEMMADSDLVYNNTAIHDSTDDSYELMNEITFQKEMD